MIIIPDYTLTFNSQLVAFEVTNNSPVPPCPCCGGKLSYRDSRMRVRQREGGAKERLLIRRLRCRDCHSCHNELPDCLVPHKHYDVETISGVLDGIVTPDDEDSEDYPCRETMRRWIYWFHGCIADMEAALRRVVSDILCSEKELLLSTQSPLDALRISCPDWLEQTLCIIYNSDVILQTDS